MSDRPKVETLRQDIAAINANMSRLSNSVAAIAATVDAKVKTHDEQISVLFQEQRHITNRVGKVEATYVTRSDADKDRDVNRAEHLTFSESITHQGNSLSRYAGIWIVVATIASAALSWGLSKI